MTYNALAKSLNEELSGCPVFKLLSQKGKAIYFPSKGILGQSAQAKGKAINATIGTAFEEDGSPLALEILEELVSVPDTAFLYAPSQGNPALRKQWKDKMIQKNPSLQTQRFSLPVVTSALTHALWVSGFLFIDEGDALIVPDLYWDNYDLLFQESFGASIKTFNTFTGGAFDVEAFEKTLLSGDTGKKTVLLNFPNNPTGYTITTSEADAIKAALLKAAMAGNQVLVLLDDAYFGLVYEDGVITESLFGMLADLHPNVVVAKLDGPTKEDYVWSFRVGFITFAFKGATDAQLQALEAKAAGAVRASISNAPGISQALLLKGYQNSAYADQKTQKYKILEQRYRQIQRIFTTHPEYENSFEAMPFNSGYFMCVKLKNAEPESVRQILLSEFDTGVIVLSGLIRIAFSAVPLEKLDRLFENLHKATLKAQ